MICLIYLNYLIYMICLIYLICRMCERFIPYTTTAIRKHLTLLGPSSVHRTWVQL